MDTFERYVRAEKSDVIRKIAAEHGGVPDGSGFRFTANTITEVDKQADKFRDAIADVPFDPTAK